MPILQIQNVCKQYQQTIALNNVSLTIEKNKIFGLIGPNGAGKTSLIRHITQILYPDSGQLFFDGEKLQPKHTKHIGYMPEERGLYKKMKVAEQLLFLGQLRGLTKKETQIKIDYWLQKMDIQNWKNKTIDELSKGMQQKVQFIATVLHQPKLLILDEPFSGLDPINAQLIEQEIFNLKQQGTTIIFSTHRMENVEEICEDMALINKGKILLSGNVQALKQAQKQYLYQVDFLENITEKKYIEELLSIQKITEKSIIIKLNENQNITQILKILLDHQLPIIGVKEILPTVAEIFINEVKKSNNA